MDETLAAFAKAKGYGWPFDVMRHSFISYAVALTQQIGQVALWAGNSEAVIKRHYLERVTEDERQGVLRDRAQTSPQRGADARGG